MANELANSDATLKSGSVEPGMELSPAHFAAEREYSQRFPQAANDAPIPQRRPSKYVDLEAMTALPQTIAVPADKLNGPLNLADPQSPADVPHMNNHAQMKIQHAKSIAMNGPEAYAFAHDAIAQSDGKLDVPTSQVAPVQKGNVASVTLIPSKRTGAALLKQEASLAENGMPGSRMAKPTSPYGATRHKKPEWTARAFGNRGSQYAGLITSPSFI